jgi:hypothetical protein
LPKVEWTQDTKNVLIVFHIDNYENLKAYFEDHNLFLNCLVNDKDFEINSELFESKKSKWI